MSSKVLNIINEWKQFLNEQQTPPAFHEAASNTMSALSVFTDEAVVESEQAFEYEVSLAKSPDPEIVERFSESLNAGKRSGFLTYYSTGDLGAMDLYLIKGHNAGFALKDGDDIVSVHNNSSLRGLGAEFMRKAKESGGRRLDHFDGFLSGLYRKFGFTDVYEVYQWDEKYSPKGWNYETVDIFDPRASIYAESIPDLSNVDRKVEVRAEDNFSIEVNPANKVVQYRYGRPDVILRRLG